MGKLLKNKKTTALLLTIVVFSVVVFYFWQSQAPIEQVRAQAQVDLYGVFETQVTNSRSYSNPFDYKVIELQATFNSPTGRTFSYFGFYAGDGNGGQNGNVWKLRFMPDEIGTWSYTYSWTDGKTGGSGSFNVVDTGLSGLLKVATDNSWYFMNSRGEPFDARLYDLPRIGSEVAIHPGFPDADWSDASNLYIEVIRTRMIADGYNMAMVDSPSNIKWPYSWWYNDQKDVFDVEVWDDYEKILQYSLENEIYIYPFDGMVLQSNKNLISTNLSRYTVARFGAYASYMGYSPTWEWMDIWSADEVDWIMQYVRDINPFPVLLSVHDCSQSTFTGWLSFSTRQAPSRTIFDGNDRRAGQQQSGAVGNCDSLGGVGDPFLNKPIIGSEDIWERPDGKYGQPRNAEEVRRGAWGVIMAGVMPLYSEWTKDNGDPGNMPGEPEVRRMFNFFYSKTDYRRYEQLNELVSSSARQISSGIVGQEYLVYDENGGSITIDLSSTALLDVFDVLWYDPKNGDEQSGGSINGGASRTLNSPFPGDTVLLLKAEALDPDVLTITNLTPSNYQTVYLQEGSQYYLDRTYTLTTIPSAYQNLLWIKTANDDKLNNTNSFLTFDVNQPVTVYVAYDQRISPTANWLLSWQNEGQSIQTSIDTLNLYSQSFCPGPITLGGNYGIDQSSMYAVLIKKNQADNYSSADLNCDQTINAADLTAFKNLWGQTGTADFNQDSFINTQDFGIMMSKWGDY